MYTAEYYFVEIVSALLGISYPFIFQIIARIDDKYRSINLVRLFRRGMAFRVYSLLLIVSIFTAIFLPVLTSKPGGETPFVWISFQGGALALIFITITFLIYLFIKIGQYYDPLRLGQIIETSLRNRAQRLRLELRTLKNREAYLTKILRASYYSEFWISEYERDRWRANIRSIRNRTREIYEQEIPNDLSFRCLTDILQYSIRDNDIELFLRMNELLMWSINEVRSEER